MNMVSINIPYNIKNIKDILKLSNTQLKNVIELGYIAYMGTVDNLYQISDEEAKNKIDDMKKDFTEKLLRKDRELENKELLIKDINKRNVQNQEISINNLKKNLHLQFETEIKYKNVQINELKKEMDEFRTIIRTNEQEKNKNIERINDKNKFEIEQIREKYEAKIENLYKTITDTKSITENSYNKGKVGEQKMHNILTMLFPKNEIIDTHCTPSRGDFIIVCDDEKNILIDNKDYSSNVPKKEIDKFHNDVQTNNDIFSGILISNSSGVAKKDDFQIDIVDNKPVIYLCNTDKNNEKIKCAVDFLKSLMKCNNIDFSNKETVDKIKKISQDCKRKIKKVKKDIDKFSNSLKNTVLDIENLVESLLICYL